MLNTMLGSLSMSLMCVIKWYVVTWFWIYIDRRCGKIITYKGAVNRKIQIKYLKGE